MLLKVIDGPGTCPRVYSYTVIIRFVDYFMDENRMRARGHST